jgi:hypothetical protein
MGGDGSMIQVQDQTLTPEHIVNSYRSVFREVHGRDPHVRHMGGQWYDVSGEMVHRLALLTEISRLSDIVRRQRSSRTDRNVINRIIARLRGL